MTLDDLLPAFKRGCDLEKRNDNYIAGERLTDYQRTKPRSRQSI